MNGSTSPVPARWAMPAFLWSIVGAVFLVHFGRRFVFYHAEPYESLVLWSMVLYTPCVLYWMRRHATFTTRNAAKYPTRWLRHWIVMPLAAATMVALVFAAPLGWLFATAAWTGGSARTIRAIALEVAPYSPGKGCNQSATLRVAARDNATCLDGLYPPSSMQPGQSLDIGIDTFAFGFLIVSIANADLPAPDPRQHSPRPDR